MDSQTKRTLAATALCMLVLFGWIQVQQIINPPQPVEPPASQNADPLPPSAAAKQAEPPAAETVLSASDPPASIEPQKNAVAPLSSPEYHAVSADATQRITLGDDHQGNGEFHFAAVMTTRGAGVESLNLADHRNHVAKDKKNPDHDPYHFLKVVKDPQSEKVYHSFVTQKLYLAEEKIEVPLDKVDWSVDTETRNADGQSVTFSTVIRKGMSDVLKLSKTYRLPRLSHHLKISYTIENRSGKPHRIRLTNSGPIGFNKAGSGYGSPHAMVALIDSEGRITDGDNTTRANAFKAENSSEAFLHGEEDHFFWTAVGNKYFTCIVVPQPLAGGRSPYPDYLEQVFARTRLSDPKAEGDLTLEHVYEPKMAIGPGKTLTLDVEAFCGPKSQHLFEEEIPEAIERRYDLSGNPDRSSCTFDAISSLMLWLLTLVYGVVGNYGVAIIVLVIIVRLCLHPVSKRGQIHMMKMQKNMGKIKPRIEAIQQQHKNDKQKINEETMKLYREEGVNPAGSVMGCLPMFLQTPIWIALYTTLNTNVDMRHMPFIGYIRDLSAPDGLITFSDPISIPLLSLVMGPFVSFNLLPVLMSAIMYGQQKLTQKLTKPDKPPPPKMDKDGNPLPDTMAQQQKMMGFMMLFMGFMFYRFPSGLCLYILSSSLLGMAEQYYIRKHIKEQDARGDFDIEKTEHKKTGWLMTKFAEAQKMAEHQRLAQSKAPTTSKRKHKKPRF